MLYLKTLQQITQNELQAVGFRAQDLALLSQQQLPTPQSFVILSNCYDKLLRLNSLKYKIEYILGHSQETVRQSLVNAYNGCRKAFLEARLPRGVETEMHEMYDSITSPLAIGDLVATNDRAPVRVILSLNAAGDPENNDTIIQNVNNFEELLVAVKEAWALAYHPSQLSARLRERYQENRLKIAVIVQVMERPQASVHAYSCLPQDHYKIYLQSYPGYLDLRDKIGKDYHALSKEGLRIIASQLSKQRNCLERNDAKELVVTEMNQKFELLERDLIEIARLTRKTERVLRTAVKIFFTNHSDGTHELLWANRLGFDVLVRQDETMQETTIQHSVERQLHRSTEELPSTLLQEPSITQTASPAPADDFIVQVSEEENLRTPASKLDMRHGVAAKLLHASLSIVRTVVERKYRSTFGETAVTDSIAEMINRLNQANVFSRAVDGALLLQAEEAAKKESNISEQEYAKTIEEVAFLMTYA